MQPDSRLALAGIISIILAFALIIAALLLPGAIRRAPPGHPQGVAHSHGSSGEQQSGDDKGEGQYNADDTGKRESRIWLHISILSSSFFGQHRLLTPVALALSMLWCVQARSAWTHHNIPPWCGGAARAPNQETEQQIPF